MSVRLKRKAKGERPYFFDDPNVDKVIAMVMGLAGEVTVMRDRLDTVERLLDQAGGLKRAAIEAYVPTAEVAADRAAWRETFLGEVLRIVAIELEAMTTGDVASYAEAVAAVEENVMPAKAKPKAVKAGTRTKTKTRMKPVKRASRR